MLCNILFLIFSVDLNNVAEISYREALKYT